MIIDIKGKAIATKDMTYTAEGSIRLDEMYMESGAETEITMSFETKHIELNFNVGEDVSIYTKGLCGLKAFGILTGWEYEYRPYDMLYTVVFKIAIVHNVNLLYEMDKPIHGAYSWNNTEEQKREEKNMKYDMWIADGWVNFKVGRKIKIERTEINMQKWRITANLWIKSPYEADYILDKMETISTLVYVEVGYNAYKCIPDNDHSVIVSQTVNGVKIRLRFEVVEQISEPTSVCQIDKVIYNNPATIVFFKDGDKVVVKCSDKDTYDPEKGLAMALCKKMLGYKEYKKTFKTHVPDEEVRESFVDKLCKIAF